jgi:hypothetical protein
MKQDTHFEKFKREGCKHRLPQELIDYIFLLTDFETCINYKDNISNVLKKLYDENGDLEMIKWLHKNKPLGFEGCTERAMDYASKNRHLEVKYLHENKHLGFEGCKTVI